MRLGYSYPNRTKKFFKKFLLFTGMDVNENEIAAAVIIVKQRIMILEDKNFVSLGVEIFNN
jgi:hypothetical protein